MIDTFNENVISLERAAKHVAKLTGKRHGRSMINRWANVGQFGVTLETICIGRQRYTSTEAIDRFFFRSEVARRQRQRARRVAGSGATLSPAAQRAIDERLARKGVVKNSNRVNH